MIMFLFAFSNSDSGKFLVFFCSCGIKYSLVTGREEVQPMDYGAQL